MTFANTRGSVPYNDIFFSVHKGSTTSIIDGTGALYCKQLQNEFHALISFAKD